MARILWTGLLIANVLIILLVLQNRNLGSKVREAESKLVLPYQGMWVPKGPEVEASSQRFVLGAPEKAAQLVLFFSAKCPYCQQSADEYEALFAEVRQHFGSGVERIAVSVTQSGARGYIANNKIDAALEIIDDQRTISLYRADTVPAILIIGRNGQIEFSQVGVISGDEEISRILNVLKGLREANNPVMEGL